MKISGVGLDCPHLKYSHGIWALKSAAPLFHVAGVNALGSCSSKFAHQWASVRNLLTFLRNALFTFYVHWILIKPYEVGTNIIPTSRWRDSKGEKSQRGQSQVWTQVYLTPNFMLLTIIPEGPKLCSSWHTHCLSNFFHDAPKLNWIPNSSTYSLAKSKQLKQYLCPNDLIPLFEK